MQYRLLGAALVAALLPLAASAHNQTRFAFGSPASAAAVTRTIHVEANDRMRLVFDSTTIHPGEVVRFVVTNRGAMPHEFGIADEAGQRAHQREMMAMPGMVHHDPNVIGLKPGETRTLIWRFPRTRGQRLVFACNLPGHYQAGMVTRLTVN